MSNQCELDTRSGTTEVGYGIALTETGIASPPPPTIPPDGTGSEEGSVTQVRSEGSPIYLVEFEFGGGTTRYLWGASDGWSATVIAADPSTPGDLFDVAGATRVIDEILANPSR